MRLITGAHYNRINIQYPHLVHAPRACSCFLVSLLIRPAINDYMIYIYTRVYIPLTSLPLPPKNAIAN